MAERLIKMIVLFLSVACALGFSEVLIAATSTGSVAVSAIVLSRCVIRFSMGGVAPQSTCDDGTKALVTIESAPAQANRPAPSKNPESGEAGSVVTLTY